MKLEEVHSQGSRWILLRNNRTKLFNKWLIDFKVILKQEIKESNTHLMLSYHQARNLLQANWLEIKPNKRTQINTEWVARVNKANRRFKWLKEEMVVNSLSPQLLKLEKITANNQKLNTNITVYNN